jgi:nucleotide-binding universal stress UspA family protein
MGVFGRIVVGVDGSDFGFEALLQAQALRAPGAPIRVVTVVEEAAASQAGFLSTDAATRLEREAAQTRERIVEILGEDPYGSVRVVRGEPVAVLLAACEGEGATLVALSGRHRSPAAGLVLGGVATTVLHDAPCSVLFARPRWGELWQPRRIVVGVDGSPCSLEALAVADDLAARLASVVHVVSASGGKGVAPPGPWLERVDEQPSERPVDALVDSSISADLVVVGSRGLHGLRSLGSVSERVAHRANCSVLVVKGGDAPERPADAEPND